ncbi:hypothetical protein FMUAM8_03730 [Nocardia cyriacigeorgica]|nr:hypothetical protein FMUAM8_03730 [Nocardia cyriacigeorgica]
MACRPATMCIGIPSAGINDTDVFRRCFSGRVRPTGPIELLARVRSGLGIEGRDTPDAAMVREAFRDTYRLA